VFAVREKSERSGSQIQPTGGLNSAVDLSCSHREVTKGWEETLYRVFAKAWFGDRFESLVVWPALAGGCSDLKFVKFDWALQNEAVGCRVPAIRASKMEMLLEKHDRFGAVGKRYRRDKGEEHD
jgi:hypothetical protein